MSSSKSSSSSDSGKKDYANGAEANGGKSGGNYARTLSNSHVHQINVLKILSHDAAERQIEPSEIKSNDVPRPVPH